MHLAPIFYYHGERHMCIERSLELGDISLFHRILKESKNSPDNNVLRGHNKKKAEPQFIGTFAF